MKYTSESIMAHDFKSAILNNLPLSIKYFAEVKSLTGIPDFVLIDNKNDSELIVSYELKLSNWKRAIHQAFRYKTFSNLAYVVIDEHSGRSAIANIKEFKKYEIGLATFNMQKRLKVHYKPNPGLPFSKSSYEEIKAKLLECMQNEQRSDI